MAVLVPMMNDQSAQDEVSCIKIIFPVSLELGQAVYCLVSRAGQVNF